MGYRDLAQVKLSLAAPFDSSRCGEWRTAAKEANGELPVSFFETVQMPLRLQVLSLNPASIADAIGAGWSDVGELQIGKVALQYSWYNTAATLIAGEKVKVGAQDELEQALNSAAVRQSLRTDGAVTVGITNALMACDLVGGYVSLSVDVSGTQNAGFHMAPFLRPSDVATVSRKIQSSRNALDPNKGGIYISDSLRTLNAAGLLGFQLRQQGYGLEIFQNGEFVSLYTKIFENGPSNPSALSNDDARSLVRSLGRVKYEPREFKISQKGVIL